MTTWNRDSAGALVFWIVSVTSGLCSRTVGLWRRCGSAVAALISIGAVGCGGTGSTGAPGPDASNDVLRGSETSVAPDSSSLDAPRGTTMDSATSDATSTSACAVSAEVYCAKYQSCEESQFGIYYGTLAICEQRVEQFCPDQFVAPGSTVTPSELEACAQEMSDQSCSDFLTSVNPPACAWVGTESTGAACEYDAQCQSGLCNVLAGSFCGTCQVAPSVGQPCDALFDCVNGLECTTTKCPGDGGACTGAELQICVKPMGAGSACDTSIECQSPLSCVQGACASLPQLGAPCDNSACDGTKSLICATNPDGGTQECVQEKFAPAGDPCNSTAFPPIYCAASGSCQSTTGETAGVGTCAAVPADGQPCNALCMPLAYCVGGTCQAPVPASSCK
jgi:hypothetical protein